MDPGSVFGKFSGNMDCGDATEACGQPFGGKHQATGCIFGVLKACASGGAKKVKKQAQSS